MTVVNKYKDNEVIINTIDYDIDEELELIHDLKYFKKDCSKTEKALKKLRKKLDKYTYVCPTCFVRFSGIHMHVFS